MNEKYLIHYGVQGMRWGFRKKIESGGHERRGIFRDIDQRRKARKIAKFDQRISRHGNAERISKIMQRRKLNSSLQDKYEDKSWKIQSKYDRDSDNASSASEYRKLSDNFTKAYKALDAQHAQNVTKAFRSLDTQQKLSIINDVKKEKGKEVVQGIGATALFMLPPIAMIAAASLKR